MKKISGILVVLALLIVCAVLLPTKAQAAKVTQSGTCGSNLTWTLDNAGTLTISGTGPMTDYTFDSYVTNLTNPPWKNTAASIKNVMIENGVSCIGMSAFEGCTGLTSITIPDSVTSISSYAFYGCTGLTSITIGNGVTSISISAFSGCTSLTSVNITDIAAWCKIAFNNKTSNPLYYAHNLYLNGNLITELVIPDSVTSIGSYAFEGCTGLTSITIPDSVTNIGSYAFEGCTGLTSITIPDSVTSIGGAAFEGCTSLTSVTIPDSVTSIGAYVFQDCDSLASITIPDSVTSIGKRAFYNCTSLTSITIPDSVTSIGDYAFYGCTGLTCITIGSGVTSIGNYAFKNCTSLTSVTYSGTQKQWNLISVGEYNSELLNAVHKYQTTPTPAAPSLSTKTSTSVTLVEVAGLEYSKDGTTWQSSNVFTSLSPNKTYTFYARVAETATDYASEKSAGLTVTTPKNTVSAPATPTLQSRTNSTIALNPTSGCEYSIDGVNWQISNTFTGLKEYTTYTLYQRYTETNTDYASAKSAGLTVTTFQICTVIPTMPTVAYKTATTIILQKLGGYEYSLGGTTWQDSNEFTGLTANTEYVFYQRVKETDTTQASDASPALQTKTTEKSECSIKPVAPIVADYTANKIVLVARTGYEYKIGNGSWTTSNTFTGLSANTSYTVYQRLAETDEEYASAASVGVIVKTVKTNGKTAATYYDTLRSYINTYGYPKSNGNMWITYTYYGGGGLAYDYGIEDTGSSIVFSVLRSDTASTRIEGTTKIELHKDSQIIVASCHILYFSSGSLMDSVNQGIGLNRSTHSASKTYTLTASGNYLTASHFSQYFNDTMTGMCEFIDKYIYDRLGFGLKALGFISYSGYGTAICDPLASYHTGGTVNRCSYSATCTVEGNTGNTYCANCGEKVSSGSTIAANGSHTYTDSCDKDCNTCGEERRIVHTYTSDCDTKCDICGHAKNAYADHAFNAEGVCTICGALDRIPGDIDGNESVTQDDAVYLLLHTMFGEAFYPLDGAEADIDGSGSVTQDDAVYLLLHTMFGETFYPLNTPAMPAKTKE